MTLNHLFSPSFFNELFQHDIVGCDGHILASDEGLQKYKEFLKDRSRMRTARIFQDRKDIVNNVQSLLKTSNRPTPFARDVKTLLKKLGLRITEEGTVALEKVAESKQDLGPSYIKQSVFERRIAAQKAGIKVQKHDLKHLDDWLARISGPKVRVKRAPERTKVEWKHEELKHRVKAESVLQEMAKNRRIFVKKCSNNVQYQWISAMEKILDNIAESKKLFKAPSKEETNQIYLVSRDKEAKNVLPRERDFLPPGIESETDHLPSTDDIERDEMIASDTVMYRSDDLSEGSEDATDLNQLKEDEFVFNDTLQKGGTNEPLVNVRQDDERGTYKTQERSASHRQSILGYEIERTDDTTPMLARSECPETSVDTIAESTASMLEGRTDPQSSAATFAESTASMLEGKNDRESSAAAVTESTVSMLEGRNDREASAATVAESTAMLEETDGGVPAANSRDQVEEGMESVPKKGRVENESVRYVPEAGSKRNNLISVKNIDEDGKSKADDVTVTPPSESSGVPADAEMWETSETDGSLSNISVDIERGIAHYSKAGVPRSHQEYATPEEKSPSPLSSARSVSQNASKRSPSDPRQEENETTDDPGR